MAIKYSSLQRHEFDAVVTGELTHHAIYFESLIDSFLAEYFKIPRDRREEFSTLFFRRDGLTFQDKIEIAYAIVRNKEGSSKTRDVLNCLKDVEKFKSLRNALAHGLAIEAGEESATEDLTIKIQIVNRSGKSRVHTITPKSHLKMMNDLYELYDKFDAAIKAFIKAR